MSATFDYAFQAVRIKRGTTNQGADISYTSLPYEVRATLDRTLAERLNLSRWNPLEYRLKTDEAVPAEQLRVIAQEIIAEIGELWEGTAAELAVVVRHTLVSSGPRIVERGRVEKSENRRQRERVARKLGKGVKHSRWGITLEGTHARLATWEEADAFVRSRLTADELRTVRVQWHRVTWDNFDNTHNSYHTLYADAVHLLGDRNGRAHVGSTAWVPVRGTLPGEIAEAIEALAGEWHGTGLELLDAARALEEA